jgi:phospholipid/cholesterol/gamma-HCH transport system substrate-binding protein
MTSEFKVGVVVLIGIVLLFYMSFRVGRFDVLHKGGYEVVAHFNNIAGLDSKSPVDLAGVEVGQVKSISLEGYRAKAVLTIKDGVKIPDDSQVAIKSLGILGDKYLQITPGQSTVYLKNHDEVKNVVAYADYDEIFASVNKAAKNFGETMEQFNGLLGEADKKNIRESVANLRTASSQFSGMLQENRTSVQRVVSNMAVVSDKLGPLTDRADSAIASISTIAKGVEEGKGTLGLLVKDEKLYYEAKETLGALKSITADIEQGKGTLGQLVKDDTLYTDMKETAKNVKELTDGINRGEGTLGKLAKDDTLANEAEKTLKKVQKAAEGLQEMTPITVLGTVFSIFF